MTSLLLDDDMSMNRINPYTSSATFGISYNGGYKTMPGMHREVFETDTAIDQDQLMFVPSAGLDEGVPTHHFNKLELNDAGNMYLKTGGIHPATSFLYPARKYQFDDGSTTFGREVIIGEAKNYVSPADFSKYTETEKGQFMLLLTLLLLAVILYLRGRR
jgi:hypothetical protein